MKECDAYLDTELGLLFPLIFLKHTSTQVYLLNKLRALLDLLTITRLSKLICSFTLVEQILQGVSQDARLVIIYKKNSLSHFLGNERFI